MIEPVAETRTEVTHIDFTRFDNTINYAVIDLFEKKMVVQKTNNVNARISASFHLPLPLVDK